MWLLYPLDEEIPGYSRDQFVEDLCNESERDIRMAFEAGATRVSVDFTEGRLTAKNDPRFVTFATDFLYGLNLYISITAILGPDVKFYKPLLT